MHKNQLRSYFSFFAAVFLTFGTMLMLDGADMVISDYVEEKPIIEAENYEENGDKLAASAPKTEFSSSSINAKKYSSTTKTTTTKSTVQNTGKTASKRPHVDPYKFEFTLLERDICRAGRKDVFLITVVHTHPDHFKQRMFIRETWGNAGIFDGLKNVVVFMMGYRNDSEKVQMRLAQESDRFHDIIQQSFTDSYRNLTYKAVMWLRWVHEFCPEAKFVLKVDDDIFVNSFNLIRHLDNMYRRDVATINTISCHVWHRNKAGQSFANGAFSIYPFLCKRRRRISTCLELWRRFHRTNRISSFSKLRSPCVKPVRKKTSKWYVSPEEYSSDVYTAYCSGSAYILSADLVPKMLNATRSVPFFWVDDVYVTGLLTAEVNATFLEQRSLYSIVDAEFIVHEHRLTNELAVFAHLSHTSINLWYQLWKRIRQQNVA